MQLLPVEFLGKEVILAEKLKIAAKQHLNIQTNGILPIEQEPQPLESIENYGDDINDWES